MNKALIIFTVVLASYLLFDKFARNDTSIEPNEKMAVKPSSKPSENRVVPEVLYVMEQSDTPETELFENKFIEATYSATIDNEHIKADLRFSFSKDGTFSDYRDMTLPKSMVGETAGTYSIEGAMLSLNYGEERDKNVFRFTKAKMSLHKDGTLRTVTVVLNKD